jgi:Mrp family chromosome partitioning ATPase
VVTSANQREGKTTLASNLAIVLAQLDKTVVLVDGDLHHPRLHEVFGVSNRLGLASVVAGQINFLEALVATSVPGVTLFPAGPCPPDPSVLLASWSSTPLPSAPSRMPCFWPPRRMGRSSAFGRPGLLGSCR